MMTKTLDQLKFNSSIERLVEIAGEPLAKRSSSTYEYWQYDSIAPSQATWLVLQDGKLVKITQPVEQELNLQKIIQEKGYPQYSGRQIKKGQLVDRMTSVHYYPKNGTAYIAQGDGYDGTILKVEKVNKLSVENYLATIIGGYEQYNLAQMIEVEDLPSSNQSLSTQFMSNVPTFILVGLVVGILSGVVIYLWRKRRSFGSLLQSQVSQHSTGPVPAIRSSIQTNTNAVQPIRNMSQPTANLPQLVVKSPPSPTETSPGATPPGDSSKTEPVSRTTYM